MATPHNSANIGDITKTVLMPGDPLRAEFIANTFLENPVRFNSVRNMYGYTGTYKGKQISVMGSGMGMPSVGIYSYELFQEYGVEQIIRIGSAGAYSEDLKIFDVVLTESAYSESSFAKTMSGYEEPYTYPDEKLNQTIARTARELGMDIKSCRIHSSDVFYRQGDADYYIRLRDELGCKAVEMESFALFHVAKALGKSAACILTISDSFVSPEITTAEERQTSFTNMMNLALESAVRECE